MKRSFDIYVELPTCPRCNEPGLHAQTDDCIKALRHAIRVEQQRPRLAELDAELAAVRKAS